MDSLNNNETLSPEGATGNSIWESIFSWFASGYNIQALVLSAAVFCVLCFLIFSKYEKVRSVCIWADSKLGGLTITFLGVMWAAQVSMFSQELKNQIFNFSFEVESFLFLIFIYLVSILVLSKEMGQSDRINKKEEKLSKQLTHLPPKKILSYISDEKEIISQLVQTCRIYYFVSVNNWSAQDASKDEIKLKKLSDDIISNIMKTLCKASALWDDDFEHNNLKYSANIFIPTGSEFLIKLAKYKSEHLIYRSIQGSPFFMLSENMQSKIEHCDGILFCQRQYSVSYSAKNDFEMSQNSSDPVICIPYCKKKDTAESPRQPNFFGASEAFVNSRVEYVGDSNEALDKFLGKLKNNGAFSGQLTNKFEQGIRNYYANDSGKSIISIPLFRYRDPFEVETSATSELIGVLNLYRDKAGILMTEERGNAFHELIRPLCFNLSYVLSLMEMYEKRSVQAKKETSK